MGWPQAGGRPAPCPGGGWGRRAGGLGGLRLSIPSTMWENHTTLLALDIISQPLAFFSIQRLKQ